MPAPHEETQGELVPRLDGNLPCVRLSPQEALQLLDGLNDEITRAQDDFAARVAQILSSASGTPLFDTEVNKALVDRFQETAARVEHRVKCPTCGLAGTLSYAQGKFKIGHRVTSHGFGDALPDATMVRVRQAAADSRAVPDP